MNTLKQNMVPGTLDSGTGPDGKLYGLLVSMNIKSLVWYNKPAWKKAGYPIPKSLDELNSLTDKIRSQGKVPWCMGVASSGSDGWPATDWFEDLILRYGGPDTYDKWVQHQIPFTDPVVQQAGNEFAKLMFTNGNVLGGRKAIDSTDFGDAPDPMFDSTPKCWMYKQGSFITAFFPNSTQKNLDKDVGVFAFPPATAGAGNPIEGGGDLATLLNNSSQAQKVMKLMSETQFGSKAAPVSSYISPHTDFPKNLYPNNITRQIAAIAAGGSTFRFDASDQMPGAVGAGSFWKEMTAWIAGQEDLNTALKNIDDSWPAS
jgi:alpha-glucoside transport system substrate-binding protein